MTPTDDRDQLAALGRLQAAFGDVQVLAVHRDEPGEVAVGEPVTQVWREQKGLVAVAAQEAIGHDQFYLLATLTPNALDSYELKRV